MARISEKSQFITPSEVDIFSVPPTDGTHLEWEDVPYRPQNNVSSGGDITFEVLGNGEENIRPNRIWLTYRARIVQGNGRPITAQHKVAPINNPGHSFFSKVVVSLGSKTVSSDSIPYPMRAMLTTLTSYGPDAKQSHINGGSLYIKDTAGHMDALPGGNNKGLNARGEHFARGEWVYFRIHVDCDIFHINKVLPTQMDLRVVFHRTKPEFCLMAGEQVTGDNENALERSAPDFKVEIGDPILWVAKVRLFSGVNIGHKKGLDEEPAKYKISRVLVRDFNIEAGVMNKSINNVFGGQIPKRIIYTLVDNAAYNGSYDKNPFNFQHANVTSAAAYVNGKSNPFAPFTPNYANADGKRRGNWVREYQSVFEALGNHYGNRGSDISMEEFPVGHCVYGSDLTSNHAASDGGKTSLIKNGDVHLDLQFGSSVKSPLTCVVLGDFDNIIEIDGDRNVSVQYAA